MGSAEKPPLGGQCLAKHSFRPGQHLAVILDQDLLAVESLIKSRPLSNTANLDCKFGFRLESALLVT